MKHKIKKFIINTIYDFFMELEGLICKAGDFVFEIRDKLDSKYYFDYIMEDDCNE